MIALESHLFDQFFSGFLNVLASVTMDGEVRLEGVMLLDHALDRCQILAKIVTAARWNNKIVWSRVSLVFIFGFPIFNSYLTPSFMVIKKKT